ncbi:unnamed protein product [Ectocarpus sp. 12 AP-2014]
MSKMLVILLLGLSALLDTSAGQPDNSGCLNSTDTDRCQTDADGELYLGFCGITEADLDDLASCLEAAGPETITSLYLDYNDLATLPEGIFQNTTGLQYL